MRLISLVGEQPIPNLLPVRFLQPEGTVLAFTSTTERVARRLESLIPGAELHPVPPYNLIEARQTLDALCTPDTIINLTGGTKPMALAAYEVALARRLPVVYLQSEGSRSELHRYEFVDGVFTRFEPQPLGGLITIADYLQAHGLRVISYKEPANAQEAVLRDWLVAQVDECLSNLVCEAFEIDFILRRGNRVAIVEAKDKKDNKRKAIDQLNTIGGRAYLGTYTGKIFITSKPLGFQLANLAAARQIVVAVTPIDHHSDADPNKLTSAGQTALLAALDKVLGPR